MKKILVTGCNGQLGRAIRKEYAASDVEFINTDVVAGNGIVSLDITNIDAVMEMVKDTKPDIIINCAAHTNVDKCEEQQDLAYKINAIGPRNLSIASSEIGAKMIHISTDYVFEGNGTRPYIEFDKPNPISAYGRTNLREKILSNNLLTGSLCSVQHGFMEMEEILSKQCSLWRRHMMN